MAIIILLLHLFMIVQGYGIYNNAYQNIQIVSLITWGYGSQTGVNSLQITNFALFKDNSFLSTFGPQFFSLLTIMIIFYTLISAVDKIPHYSTATLLKRKKIIFPFRL
jgi:hypothetical protein